jgi:hypothetical protein
MVNVTKSNFIEVREMEMDILLKTKSWRGHKQSLPQCRKQNVGVLFVAGDRLKINIEVLLFVFYNNNGRKLPIRRKKSCYCCVINFSQLIPIIPIMTSYSFFNIFLLLQPTDFLYITQMISLSFFHA